jgi:hypothetical protein
MSWAVDSQNRGCPLSSLPSCYRAYLAAPQKYGSEIRYFLECSVPFVAERLRHARAYRAEIHNKDSWPTPQFSLGENGPLAPCQF